MTSRLTESQRKPGPGLGEWRQTHGAEFAITIVPVSGEGLVEMFRRLAFTLHELEATIVNQIVFGALDAHPAAMEAMRSCIGCVDWPVTWVEGGSCSSHPIAGVQVFAFAGSAVQRIVHRNRVVGSVFDDGAARHCLLGGVYPSNPSQAPGDQAREVIELLGNSLEQAGFSFNNVVRTWYYNEDILAWYGEFNRARTELYAPIRFRSGALPASTGISARNSAGAALVAGARAAKPIGTVIGLEQVASPLQGSAAAYGSSFSRALELGSVRGRHLFVSGTASIGMGGETMWPGDVRRQIDRTMEVVRMILDSRGFGWPDVTRATAYFKNRGDVRFFAEWCLARRMLSLPVVLVQSGVCRDELLFEVEVDAWRAADPAGGALECEFDI